MTSQSRAPMLALIDVDSAVMAHGEPAIAPVHAATAPNGDPDAARQHG